MLGTYMPYAPYMPYMPYIPYLRATRNDEHVPGIGLDAGTTAPVQAWFNVSIFGGDKSWVAEVELATASEPPVRKPRTWGRRPSGRPQPPLG